MAAVMRQGIVVPGPGMPPQGTPSFIAPAAAAPEPTASVATTTSDPNPEPLTGSPSMPNGGVPIIGVPNSQDYPRVIFAAPYFNTVGAEVFASGLFLPISGGTLTAPGNLTVDGQFQQLRTTDNGWNIFAPVDFLVTQHGGANGAVFYYYNDAPPATDGLPPALTGYGKLAPTATGNSVFGVYGRVSLPSGLTAGSAVAAEFTAHNDTGLPPDTAIPPDNAIGTPKVAPIGVQVTCGGANDCCTGVAIESEGEGTTRWQTALYGASYAQYGIYIDDFNAAPTAISAWLKNTGGGTNLVCQTTGAMVPGNPVINVVNLGGTSYFRVNQNGDTTVGALIVVGTLQTDSNATIGNALTVNGPATFQQTISVGGLGISNAAGVLQVAAPFSTTGTANIGSGLTVAGQGVFQQSITVGGILLQNAAGVLQSANTIAAPSYNIVPAANVDAQLVLNGTSTAGGHTYWVMSRGNANVGEFWIYDATASALRIEIGTTGTCSASSAWGIISDASVKSDVEDHPHGLAEILQLQPRRFTYNGNQGLEGEGSGLIAQELEAIMPELVRDMPTGDGGTIKTVVETGVIWPLINAVKELSARLAALEAKADA